MFLFSSVTELLLGPVLLETSCLQLLRVGIKRITISKTMHTATSFPVYPPRGKKIKFLPRYNTQMGKTEVDTFKLR